MELKLRSALQFDIGADVPHRALTDATDAALAAARASVRGSVDAVGSLGSARDGSRRVRIEMTLRVAEGGAAAGLAAEKAFAEAFCAALARKGLTAARA
jgi:hypothetical protein